MVTTLGKPLPSTSLRRSVNPAELQPQMGVELPKPLGLIGQERAVRSLQFSIEMEGPGFNVYVAGPPGIGKMTAVRRYLEEAAKSRPTPSDWCYVHNFDDASTPRALELPPGRARELQADMDRLIELTKRDIPSAFESEEYGAKREQIEAEVQEKKNRAFQELADSAEAVRFGIQIAPFGIALIPLKDGKPMSEAEFNALPKEEQDIYEESRKKLNQAIKATMKRVRGFDREGFEAVQELDRRVALFVVGDLADDLFEKYEGLPQVIEYLTSIKNAILEDIRLFRSREDPEAQMLGSPAALLLGTDDIKFRRFRVNVVVDNSGQQGAPVVVELNPSYTNLFGRVEKESRLGALYTDFTQIRSGSLHRANGGYLVLPIEAVLRNFMSWDGLKRAVRSGEIEIEDLAERLGYISTKGLRPQPIPLNVKVVLVGQRFIQHLLVEFDEEYAELFKVKADFDTRMTMSPEGIRDFLSFLRAYCEGECLPSLDDTACAAILEYALRLAEDQERLSTQFGRIGDAIREAAYWAKRSGETVVRREHVEQALEQRVYRSRLIQDRIQEMMLRGSLLVDTEGAKAGQVNGLSVLSVGEYAFGRPSRITASVGPGTDGLLDIEREVELGGPIHSKGVLILGGYLLGRYRTELPLALSARLVFEQSYEGVEGDSASCAELAALLSALSGVPVKQSIAITGSVNQLGQVQAIGGVNEKIEGFYEVCKARGLSGEQGVVIPASNVQNLMLKSEIVETAKQGRFHVWAVATVDEALSILTGAPAGERDPQGRFPSGTLNALVESRLNELSSIAGEALKEPSARKRGGSRLKKSSSH